MKVTGSSMEPALQHGDYVLVNRWAYLFREPQVQDIVVVRYCGRLMVKRIVRAHNRCFAVMGDHVQKSTDSRHFGTVSRTNILGKVWKRIKKGSL